MCAVSSAPPPADTLAELVARRHIPRATYRLQFNSGFTFEQACQITGYLAELGVSDCYASPLLKACTGSPHGYDIVDHHQLNPAMGGAEGFESFSAALRNQGLGLVLDIVPNHMGIGEPSNAWWMDVLENGPGSIYAPYFDIDWQPVKRELENKVLLPVLEDQFGKVLEAGKLVLRYEDGAFFLYYYETKLPIAPRTYSLILGHQLERLTRELGAEDANLQELQSILTALSYLPPRQELTAEKITERNREKEVIKRRVARLYEASPEVRAAIDQTVALFNGDPADPHSYDLLDQMLADQAYRPAFWRVATEEINYRRFFDITKLAAIRTELPEVFRATHELIFRLVGEGKVSGLRVDHPDGLWNPEKYFRWLQETYLATMTKARTEGQATGQATGEPPEVVDERICTLLDELADQAKGGPVGWPLYVVAEKILSEEEPLPENWAVYGTTGYDYLNQANGLFVNSDGRKSFDKIYNQFIGHVIHFGDLINGSKKMIMSASLASEANALSHQLERLAERNRLYRDFTLNSLTAVIREVIAALGVYRTYIVDSTREVSPHDQHYVEAAVGEAQRRNPRLPQALFDFIRNTLLLRNMGDFREEDRPKLFQFVMKFQQVTGPVMAKGLEDTAFYIYNRLVSLNEVGGHPLAFGLAPEKFHQLCAERLRHWPHSLLASATHDTKRGEDVRARLNVLSELPGEWRAALNRWSRMNARKKVLVDGEPAPTRNDEYLLYQALLGTLPAGPLGDEEYHALRERITAYMLKATKEAKTHTSWINPSAAYDQAVVNFVAGLLPKKRRDRFVEQLTAFARRLAFFGQFNSLAQTLLKLTVPGVPDLYQGTELWDLSLVDPDNRRPVDYELRRRLLAGLKEEVARAEGDLAGWAGNLLANSHDGRIKLYLIQAALNFRREHELLFSQGDYVPLQPTGPKKAHILAFARTRPKGDAGDAGAAAVVVVPRLVALLSGGQERPPLGEELWRDTRLALPEGLARGGWRNVLTGEELVSEGPENAPALALGRVLNSFPVALLEHIPR